MPPPLSRDLSPVSVAPLDEQGFERQLRQASTNLVLALGVPLILLFALVLFLYRTALWVDHTDQVLAEANHTDRLLVGMQSGFRGYRLSTDIALLQPYVDGHAQVGPQIDALSALVADNDRQISEVTSLRREIETWIAFVDGELARIRAGTTVINDPGFLRQGAPLFENTQKRLHAFVKEEEGLRSLRELRLDTLVLSALGALGVAAVVGVFGLSHWLKTLLREVTFSYRTSLDSTARRANELHVTLHSIGDAVVATDAQGAVNFLNPAAEALMGWTSAEARGRPLAEVFQIFNEDTHLVTPNPVDRVLRENIVVGLANHTVLRSRDGHEYPIEDSAAPIRNERGDVAGVILVFHDVSERRSVERALEASEKRLRFIDELSHATRLAVDPVSIMTISVERLGRHLRASRCAYADVETDGDHFTIHPDYTDGCASTAGRYELSRFGPKAVAQMQQGQPLVVRNVDAELAPAEGGEMFNAIGIKALICFPLIKHGTLRAMMAVHQTTPRDWTAAEVNLVQDITERCWATVEKARAETELRAATAEAATLARGVADAAERFRLLAEVVSLQVWTATLEGQLDFANHECLVYFGVTSDREILGSAWAQFVHPDDAPPVIEAWQKSLATGHRYEVEFRLRNREGAYRWFLVRAQAMRDGHGAIVKWFGTNTDIDEIKRARSEAEAANRAKDDFLAILSHELRTPLTPVLMSAAALRDDGRIPAEVREQLGMMERNIALEARLIDDLLDLTSINRGKLQLRPQSCEAHALIDLAIAIVHDDAAAKQITIARHCVAKHTGLKADPVRFQQVIWNILRNAVKFTPRGGNIQVTTRDIASCGTAQLPGLRVEVIDSGIGIEPVVLEKIFQPFEQAGMGGNHRYGGMGLGLSIARAIMTLHGGTVSAHSLGVDRGAAFTIEIPSTAAPAAAPVPSGNRPAAGKTSGPGLRLLLVEDHDATLRVLLRLLQNDGHEVSSATSVAEGLAAAANGTFDLVISDLGLPDGTGNELMERLRQAHDLRGIALTGYGMDDDIAQARASGFISHLTKPIDFAQLRELIATVRAGL